MIRDNNSYRSNWGLFILRIFLGLRLIYGVFDNILDWDRMIEFSLFLEAHHFPVPIISAVTSALAQFLCGGGILIGLKTRLLSLIMVIHFLVAIFMVHLSDTIEAMTPALAMLFISLSLFFTGPGRFSMDRDN